MTCDLKVDLCGLKLENPLIAASGCYGFGEEASRYLDSRSWGALCSKGTTRERREGNPSPRVVETASGMLNSVGLQNPGIDAFLANELPRMLKGSPPIIANIAGNTVEDYVYLCRRLEASGVSAIELNLSCPNVSRGCMAIGSDPLLIEETVAAARQASRLPLIAKLTPNTSDIVAAALAAEAGGADAVSLINTLLGMAVDLETRRPVLRNNTGGLSGPAIKPVALRMCAEVCRHLRIPVIAMGGIFSGEDVLEFILAGATCVQLGVVNFVRPLAVREILCEMEERMAALGIRSLHEIRGKLQYWN